MIGETSEGGKTSFGETCFIIHRPTHPPPPKKVDLQHSRNKSKIHLQWFHKPKNYTHSCKFTTRRLSLAVYTNKKTSNISGFCELFDRNVLPISFQKHKKILLTYKNCTLKVHSQLGSSTVQQILQET